MPNQATLTHRETEIVRLIADGKRNPEIATTLHITIHTVETHLRNIYSKLAIHTSTEAARWFWQHQPVPHSLVPMHDNMHYPVQPGLKILESVMCKHHHSYKLLPGKQ